MTLPARIWLDLETISNTNAVKHGIYEHAGDCGLNVTVMAYALDDGPVEQVRFHFADGETPDAEDVFPEELKAAILAGTPIWVHNAAYERHVMNAVFGLKIQPEQMRDSVIVARWFNLPAGLKGSRPTPCAPGRSSSGTFQGKQGIVTIYALPADAEELRKPKEDCL
jgi:hypothetical protein